MIKTGPIVRPATREDYPAIAGVLDRAFGRRPYRHRLDLWKWRYDLNPARTDAIPPFLVVDESGRIAGVQGLIPLRIKAGDTELRISCSCDLAVDPAARTAGMKLKLAAMAKELSPLHLSTSANEPANRISLALGGKEVPSGRRKYILPLKASGLMRRRFDGRGTAARIAAVASMGIAKPVDWILAVRRRARRSGRVADGKIRDVTFFDGRYDGFWKELANEQLIFSVRDSTYLNWRYSGYPFPGIQSFEWTRAGELLGFAVIHLAIDEDRLLFAAILELAGRRETGAPELLLEETVRRAADGGAHYLIGRAPTPEDEDLLRKSGFLRRDMAYSPVTYKNNSDVSPELLGRNENWYVTLGDGDGSYYFPEEGPES